MLRCIAVTPGAVILQVVIGGAVGLQVIGVVIRCLHIVVGVLIETAEGIAVVQLVVEASSALEIRVACCRMMAVGDSPQRIGKDGLLKFALLPTFVVSSKEVGKQFQLSCAIGQIETLIVCVAVTLATP